MPPATSILEAGKLRHVVQIVAPTEAQDTFGGTIVTADDVFATVRASVEALTGRELYAAQQVTDQVTHRITIRWLPGLKENMNIWFDNGDGNKRQFQIQYILNPDERHKMLVLLCIEREDSSREPPGATA